MSRQPKTDLKVKTNLKPEAESDPKIDKEGAGAVVQEYEVERALEAAKSQKDLEKAALTDEKAAARLAKAERKRKGLALLDDIDAGKVSIVGSRGPETLKKETVKEYLETFLLGLAVILGKKPASDLKFDPEASYDRLASGLNKIAPEFAAQLEAGSGYADLAVGVAGVGK